MRWSGIIAVEGEQSVDGRTIRPDGLTWGDEEIPLRQFVPMPSREGYADAVTFGSVDPAMIERREGGLIYAEGYVIEGALEVGMPLAITADRVEFVPDGDGNDETTSMTMVTGRIVEVVVPTQSPAWAQCVVLEVTE